MAASNASRHFDSARPDRARPRTLAGLAQGQSATIAALRPGEGAAIADHLERLMELGFLPGERVRIVAKGYPSGDPIAVRIGLATFALRRFEADLIEVHSAAAAP